MDLNITTETFNDDDRTWLGSKHGTETADTVTLDGSAFTATWADGIVPSGVALGKITATGLYAPYTDAATHGAGSDTCVGFLYSRTKVIKAAAVHDVGAPLLRHCEIREANLPANHGVTAAAKVDVAGRIWFV